MAKGSILNFLHCHYLVLNLLHMALNVRVLAAEQQSLRFSKTIVLVKFYAVALLKEQHLYLHFR